MRLNLHFARRVSRSSLGVILLAMLLGCSLVGITTWLATGSASAASIASPAPPVERGVLSGVSPGAPDCPPNWNIVGSPNPSTNNYLYGVAVVSANDIWAVGNYYNANVSGAGAALFEHWDGISWTQVPGANSPADRAGRMYGVAAVSHNDVWAVGMYYPGTDGQTLIEHWDGTQWSVVPSPNRTGLNQLLGATAFAADDVWAVGDSSGDHAALAEHWNGSYWAIVPCSPISFSSNYHLYGIAGVASNDVWAVGFTDDQSAQTTPFIDHWNGTAWTEISAPHPGSYANSYYGVTAPAPNDVWAVGSYSNDGGDRFPLMAHWNGTAWTAVPGNSSHTYNDLHSVSAAAPNDIWAVGLDTDCNLCLQFHTLIEHYDGTSWSVVPSPDGNNQFNRLRGVAAVSSSDVWAVGLSDQYDYPYYSDTLIERHTCAPPPTVTGTPPTATQTATSLPSATPTACSPQNENYTITQSAGATVVPATTDIGLHCENNCATTIAVPFQYSLYGQPFNQVVVGSNGTLGFVRNNNPNASACLPSQEFDYAILPYWQALHLSVSGNGIFTSVEGSAPNRIFNIEWRAYDYFYTAPVNVEVRLYESTTSEHFDVIYGSVPSLSNQQVTIGVQKGQGFLYTQFVCENQPSVMSNGIMLAFTQPACGPTATPPLPSATPTTMISQTPAPTQTAGLRTPTDTPAPPSNSPTRTDTPLPTQTPGGPTATAVPPSATPTHPSGSTPTTTATPCTTSFTDVHPADYFYTPVLYLACHGVISGYNDGTFRPYANTTRSQMVKIVVLGFNKAVITPVGSNYSFTDVPRTNPFFPVVETAYADGIVSGYTCGVAPAGPCDSAHRPYFLPYANVTRSQLSKIDVIAAGWTLSNPATATFTDVAHGSTFYQVVETAVCHGVISGYNDHTFRPFANATRGQISKIVYLSIVNPPASCGP